MTAAAYFRKSCSSKAVMDAEGVVAAARKRLAEAYETLALARQLHRADTARLIGEPAAQPQRPLR